MARKLQFALRRLARRQASETVTAAAVTAATHAAKRLDGLILEPLAVDIGDRALVIAPTGTLHALPWSLLPSCRGRPVAVTPCAALWHTAITAEKTDTLERRVVLVAGPGLPHAADEVRRLGRRYPDALRLVGRNARTADVLAALDGAALAHVTAHGTFRADNPLFSAIRLADGPVTVYDLETLRRPPELLLLSACESGLSAVRPGDELMGLAASILGLGTRSLVASVVAVPDDHTAHLMVALRRYLQAGAGPAEALCRAQASVEVTEARAMVVSAGFVCFGAG